MQWGLKYSSRKVAERASAFFWVDWTSEGGGPVFCIARCILVFSSPNSTGHRTRITRSCAPVLERKHSDTRWPLCDNSHFQALPAMRASSSPVTGQDWCALCCLRVLLFLRGCAGDPGTSAQRYLCCHSRQQLWYCLSCSARTVCRRQRT